MTPNIPISNTNKDDSRHGHDDTYKEDDGSDEQAIHKDDDDDEDDDRVEIGLCRQLALCAGLMASDGGLVFLQLAMMPCLQTLGVPVSLVTVAGVISGSLALMGLPLLGWISDGGSNPHNRKKPAVVMSALVFVAGYSLVIAGCILRLNSAWHDPAANDSFSVTSSPDVSTLPDSFQGSSVPASEHNLRFPTTAVNTNTQMYDTLLNGNNPLQPSSLNNYSSMTNADPHVKVTSSANRFRESLTSNPTPTSRREDVTEDSAHNSSSVDSSEWSADPLGLGIPLTGLLGILGFVFMDMGNDFNNSCLKGFVLSCTARVQHNSLFVVGVLMSAVGGCVAAVLGVFDVAAFIIEGSEADAVPSKTTVQAGFFIVFTLGCMMVTILSAPPFVAVKSMPDDPAKSKLSDHTGPSDVAFIESNVFPVSEAPDATHHTDHIRNGTYVSFSGSSRPTESLLGNSKDPKNVDALKGDRVDTETKASRSSSQESQCSKLSESLTHTGDSGVKTRSSTSSYNECSMELDRDDDIEEIKSVQQKFLDEKKPQPDSETTAYCCFGKFSIKKSTLRMIPVCTSMFFMAGAWQSFNICATDYLGKVIYGGDPDADRTDPAYVAYQQGISTGSLGVLMLNIAYVIINLLQKRILALIGPKAEYLLVCGVQAGVLLTLYFTNKVWVFYMAAIVYGLFRSVMYTVPFMLANTICQQATSKAQDGSAKVGSTMALMTAMMPLSYVLVSTVTGPLIHATGNPAAPLFYAIAATTLAATVFAFT